MKQCWRCGKRRTIAVDAGETTTADVSSSTHVVRRLHEFLCTVMSAAVVRVLMDGDDFSRGHEEGDEE
jgi:hypothetical protein